MIADKWSYLLKGTPITKEDLEDSLMESVGDIGWLKMMLTSLGDSTDLSAAIVAKIINTKKSDLIKLTLQVQTKLFNAMEEYTKHTGISGNKMWDFLFQKDEFGKKTGRYIERDVFVNGRRYDPLTPKHHRERTELKNALESAKTAGERVAAIKKYIPESWYTSLIHKEVIYSSENKEILSFFTKTASTLSEYQDKSYEKLTTPQKKLYDTWYTIKTQMDDMLPQGKRLTNLLPQVKKGFLESIKDSKGKRMKEITSHMDLTTKPNSKGLWKQDGTEAKFIPVHYLGEIDPELIEEDLAGTLVLYAEMTINNMLMHDIEYDINMIQNLVAQRDVSQIKFGNIVSSLVQGQTVVPTLKGKQTNLYRQIKEYVEMNLYGETQKDEIMTVLGISIDLGKTANMLNQYTTVKGLALNVFSGVSNVTFGTMQRLGEAISGEHFTLKDWAWANKEYFAGITKDISDITSPVPKTKFGLFVRNLDVAHSFKEGIRDSSKNLSKRGIAHKLLKFSNVFFLNTMGEHMLQLTSALAMAKNFKLLNGRVANLYAEAKVDPKNGRLEYPSDVTKGDLFNYKQLVTRVNQSMDGIYNPEDRAMAQRYAVGRMSFLFRKFIVPSFEKRWANANTPGFNLKSRKYEEGFYISFGKFMHSLFTEMKAANVSMSTFRNTWNKTDDYRRAGVIKATYEIGSILVLALILGMLEGDIDDDDKLVQFIIYQINRLYTEMGAFFPLTAPQDFFRIVKSPAAGINTTQDIIRFFGDLIPPYEVYEGGKHIGDTRLFWHSLRMVPFFNQYDRINSIPEQTKALKVLF